ncbi:hypothetical protein C8Q77DRAFT_1158338 [Trametes polyzona]|nr:hypothetical protein C8Q77DRAFT_1158338 [Trametes polyzona]
MGVAGLWDVLRPAGKPRSLTHIAVKDGFEANPDAKRGFRIGIDASIWFYHATYGREGENPELRTLFFRCTRLMTMPFLPLFVFDGPKRPDIKRGKRITGKNHWMVQGMQEIITAFGFEWRMAPGEAEAELAYLNRIGVIDAVLSDDVDTFLFGAQTVIRNPSATLSGNRSHSLKNSAGKVDGNHAMVYRASDILTHPDIQLTQGGLILIGILRGGDYSQSGLDGCGVTTAHGLAKCGFGDTLLHAARTLPRDALPAFLDTWRDALRTELRTNAQGHLQRKSAKLAASIPDDFPPLDVVLAYTAPVTSEAKGPGHRNAVVDWDKEPDLGKIAALCEMYFEWGIKEIIIKRFRTVLWPSAVLRILRRAAILKDRKAALLAARTNSGTDGAPATPRKTGKERRAPPGTPSSMIARHFSTLNLDSPYARKASAASDLNSDSDEEEASPLIVKIHSSRRHPSTDNILEYRLEIAPAQLVRLCEAGLRGLRTALPPDLSDSDLDDSGDEDDEGGGGKRGKKKTKTKKPPPDPESHIRIWLPACMVEMVEPEMVDEFEGVQQMRAEKKAKAKKGAGAGAKGTKKTAPAAIAEEEEESGSDLDLSARAGSNEPRPPSPPPKAKGALPAAKTKAAGPVDKPAAKASGTNGVTSKGVDDFFAAKKRTTAIPVKAAKASTTTTKAARIAELFRDDDSPKARRKAPPLATTEIDSDDDEVPRPPHLSCPGSSSTSTTTATSSVRPSASRATSSRTLDLLQTTSTAIRPTNPPKTKSHPASSSALTYTTSSARCPSPPKPRTIRPFPMELDLLKDDSPASPPPVDEDLFTTTSGPSSGSWSRSTFGSGAASRSSSARNSTSTRPPPSSDSDDGCSRSSTLQKSPRRSEKHASPRTSIAQLRSNAARREEEEESSSSSAEDEGGRPPSPSPMKGRLPATLGARARTSPSASASASSRLLRREEEEEESDSEHAPPSPSSSRRRVAPPSKPGGLPMRTRKAAPLPADLTIISISSGSEDEMPLPSPPRPPAPVRKATAPASLTPLEQARARLKKAPSAPASAAISASQVRCGKVPTHPAVPPAKTSRGTASRRLRYDPDDIIDLT